MKRFIMPLLALAIIVQAAPVGADQNGAALASVKRMVAFIRYSETKPDYGQKALDLIDFDAISKYLLDDSYQSATTPQRERFKQLLREYVQLNAFPRAVQYFKDIDLTYDAPVLNKNQVRIHSSLLYGASERLHFTWVLEERSDGYLVVDVLNDQNISSMQLNRDKQVQPLIKKKGMDGMLNQFEKIVESLR